MRIAFVTPEYVTERNFDGGLASHLGRVCPMLAARGHHVTVFVPSDVDEVISRDGVEVCRVFVPQFGGPIWLRALFLKRLRSTKSRLRQSWYLNRACKKVHKVSRFDIIQYSSYAAVGMFRPKSAVSVMRLSSYEPLFQRAYSLPGSLDNRLIAYMERYTLLHADSVFSPSRLIAEAVESDTGRSVSVIEPPFEHRSDYTDERPFRDLLLGKRYVLFFGTLGVLKGVLSIADILLPLLTEHANLYFVFIGKDGGYANHTMMEHVWEKAGSCRGRVLYLGQMPPSQLHPILASAAAVVMPSRVDNLPNACIEAMACRRIVIGTRGASFEQLIVDGVSGFLISIDSPSELLAAIHKTLRLSASEVFCIGERAACRVAELDPRVTIDRLVSFYQSTIAGRAGRV